MTALPPLPQTQSLWRDTAGPAPDAQPLRGDAQADIAIVGGGYTGLSTARALAAQGVDAIVLEASRIGWGASGRNGGVVSGKFRLGFATICSASSEVCGDIVIAKKGRAEISLLLVGDDS